jgi:hypothetical protein
VARPNVQRSSIRAVHVRRALLLFAIVLGMAALAASVSRPPQERKTEQRREPAPTTAAPTPASQAPKPLSFDAGEPESRRLPTGRAASLEVAVDEPGSVDIPMLGLTAPAEPLTPARFEVLPASPGRYEIRFTPAASGESRAAGELVVTG